MKKIGFIGTGKMGYPMMLGAIRAFGAANVAFSAKTEKTKERVTKETGIESAKDNASLIQECDVIVLGVKPQFFHEIYGDLKKHMTKEKMIISLAAGVTIKDMADQVGADIKIVRSMPNTPAMVGEGMTCVSYSEHAFTDEEKEIVDRFFTSCGKYQVIPETLMNAAICANGSSPAYVYMFIEALADSVVKYGIPRAMAYELVSQTVLGAAKMVLETKEHPGRLKDNVCSPGGTTIAGVAALEEFGFRNAVIKATDACYEKATRL